MLAMAKQRSTERTVTDEEIGVAFIQRINGASMKTLEKRLGVSRWTLTRHFKRFAAYISQFGDMPHPRTIASVVELARGIRKQHLSEAILDLHEVLHYRQLDGFVTLRTLGRIIGANDQTTWHRFYELSKTLRRFGIHFGKRLDDVDASRMDARLVFGVARLRAFVNRELPHAEDALARFKGRKRINGRFRGNGKETTDGD